MTNAKPVQRRHHIHNDDPFLNLAADLPSPRSTAGPEEEPSDSLATRVRGPPHRTHRPGLAG
jgi:hypothetical protein